MKRAALRLLYTITILVLPLVSILSCSTTAAEIPQEEPWDKSEGYSDTQKSLSDSGLWAVGRKKLEVGGRRFNLDCSGVVLAVYYRAGIDLQPMLTDFKGGGVQRLYSLMKHNELTYRPARPEPGDMLFWDNTYDKNGNRKKDDELTHVGMVVRSLDDGTVEYVHHNYRKGIVLARMNLSDPDNLDVNSPMRARGEEAGHAPLWLSSHLLKDAARGYELK
jgi:hypothetical protein